MKGYYKRRNHGAFYRKGHPYFAKKSTHLIKNTSPQPSTSQHLESEPPGDVTRKHSSRFQQKVEHGRTISNEQSGSNQRHHLRPRKLKKTVSDGNRIVNNIKMVEMMNSLYAAHARHKCENLQVKIVQEIKYGLAWAFKFQCQNCRFTSAFYKSYQEVSLGNRTKRGKKSAVVNLSLAIGLMDTPIGNAKFRLLLTALDIPPPTKTNMQRHSNTVSEKIKELNQKDMSEKRKLVEAHNIHLSKTGNPKEINFSLDGRYNSRGFGSAQKPGQSSSQAYTVAVENLTEQQYVIALAPENKLCWTGARLRSRGFAVKCPGGHAECTANLEYVAPHSERNMAYRIAADLSLEDYWAFSVTTDGDTKAWLGVQDFYQTLKSTWSVDRQADPNHLGVRQINKCRKASFSKGMFPNLSSQRDARSRALNAFSKDVRSRCTLVIEELFKRGRGDLDEIVSFLPDTVAATINCYAGNCSFCPEKSLMCSGVDKGCWWVKSSFLAPHHITHLEMNEGDKQLLKAILEMRLSEDALLKVSSGTSTQKCEAFNSSTASTLRKGVNYSRNFEGRVNSAAHRINNTLGKSLKDKISYVTGRQLSPQTTSALDDITRDYERHKQDTVTYSFKRNRVRKRARNEADYYLYREGLPDNLEPDYIKGQLDDEHNYASSGRKIVKKRKRP